MADAVVVGSEINSLACAALLARGGWSVRVLEREHELGGCIRTAELTEPGYLHDVFSAWHPLWVGGAAHAELGQELAARGKVVLFSSHELETVERVSSRVVILHRGKVVADDSIARLRTLMSLPTLEDIFAQLAMEQDTATVSREIADLILG